MIIFYERTVIMAVTNSTPYFSARNLLIEDPGREKAMEQKAASGLFAKVTPKDGMIERFEKDIAELSTWAIRVIPEMCDDEGRALVERIRQSLQSKPSKI